MAIFGGASGKSASHGVKDLARGFKELGWGSDGPCDPESRLGVVLDMSALALLGPYGVYGLGMSRRIGGDRYL